MKLRRKIAIATWDAPREGNIYAKLVIDARPALEYIQKLRAENELLKLDHAELTKNYYDVLKKYSK